MNKESIALISKLFKRINDEVKEDYKEDDLGAHPKLKKTRLIEIAMEIGLNEIDNGNMIVFYDPKHKDWFAD